MSKTSLVYMKSWRCHLSYHQSGLNMCPQCMSCHKATVVITGSTHYFLDLWNHNRSFKVSNKNGHCLNCLESQEIFVFTSPQPSLRYILYYHKYIYIYIYIYIYKLLLSYILLLLALLLYHCVGEFVSLWWQETVYPRENNGEHCKRKMFGMSKRNSMTTKLNTHNIEAIFLKKYEKNMLNNH